MITVPEKLKASVAKILEEADITIGGDKPWDVHIKNDRAYLRVLSSGTLGLGESYMAGDWDCDRLDIAVDKIYKAHLETYIKKNPRFIAQVISAKIRNYGTKNQIPEIAAHYDLGNDLYEAMLDKRMAYTCAYWKGAKNLDEAQENKFDLICRKLELKPGMTVLDIGGGWGSFIKYAAEKYGISGVMVSIAKEQVAWAQEACKGLPVECRVQDYRDVTGTFDRVVSIGLFEHIGPKNYKTYMQVVRRCLKEDGLTLLHTISARRTDPTMDPWIHKYVFPNGILSSLKQIAEVAEDYFVVEDMQNIGANYDLTLMAWYENFEKNWKGDLEKKYGGETFYRMWRMYLLTCAGGFRARENELYQLVMSPHGVPGGYIAAR